MEVVTDIINNGIINVNLHSVPVLNKTVIVLGISRSGTSMAVKVLEEIGVFMGDKKSVVSYEDRSIFELLESNRIKEFDKMVSERNKKYKLWGWKRPDSISYVNRFIDKVENPHFVIMFRDLVAIASRNYISENIDAIKNMNDSHLRFKIMLDFLEKYKYPTTLISYEKAITKPEEFVKSLMSFLGISEDQNLINRAVSVIQPNSKEYVKHSYYKRDRKDEVVNYKGFIDIVTSKKIVGWIFSPESKEPLEIELYIDNKSVAKQRANTYRAGVKNIGLHKDGRVGYIFTDVKIMSRLKDKSKIEIFHEGKSVLINNNPFIYTKEKFTNTLIIGLAKSGTTMLTFLLSKSYKNSKVHFEPQKIFIEPKENEVLLSPDHHNITKCLFSSNVNLKKYALLQKYYNKRIWIIRDPRDNLISSFLYRWFKGHNPDKELFKIALKNIERKEKNSKEVSLRESIEPVMDIKEYFEDRYNHMCNILQELDSSWFVVKYEDIIDDNYEELQNYMGVQLSRDKEIPKKFRRVVRSKKYGNWRRWFTEKDVTYFKPLLSPILEKLGYDHTDWELSDDPISSEEGSIYMKKISGIS